MTIQILTTRASMAPNNRAEMPDLADRMRSEARSSGIAGGSDAVTPPATRDDNKKSKDKSKDKEVDKDGEIEFLVPISPMQIEHDDSDDAVKTPESLPMMVSVKLSSKSATDKGGATQEPAAASGAEPVRAAGQGREPVDDAGAAHADQAQRPVAAAPLSPGVAAPAHAIGSQGSPALVGTQAAGTRPGDMQPIGTRAGSADLAGHKRAGTARAATQAAPLAPAKDAGRKTPQASGADNRDHESSDGPAPAPEGAMRHELSQRPHAEVSHSAKPEAPARPAITAPLPTQSVESLSPKAIAETNLTYRFQSLGPQASVDLRFDPGASAGTVVATPSNDHVRQLIDTQLQQDGAPPSLLRLEDREGGRNPQRDDASFGRDQADEETDDQDGA